MTITRKDNTENVRDAIAKFTSVPAIVTKREENGCVCKLKILGHQ